MSHVEVENNWNKIDLFMSNDPYILDPMKIQSNGIPSILGTHPNSNHFEVNIERTYFRKYLHGRRLPQNE